MCFSSRCVYFCSHSVCSLLLLYIFVVCFMSITLLCLCWCITRKDLFVTSIRQLTHVDCRYINTSSCACMETFFSDAYSPVFIRELSTKNFNGLFIDTLREMQRLQSSVLKIPQIFVFFIQCIKKIVVFSILFMSSRAKKNTNSYCSIGIPPNGILSSIL